MTKNRINFKSNVPDLLYRQAGGRCSIPRCKNPTMGPYYDNQGAQNVGVACHIYSASPDGPRGQGNKNADFISSESNGLWCCSYHATLIDKNGGKDYPAETLFAWKKLAEARVLKQMNDIPSPLGWVSSINFITYRSRKQPPKIELSRRTFIYGRNGVGKTSLMSIAASINQSTYANMFFRNQANGSQSAYKAEITYSTVDSFSKTITIDVTNGKLSRFDGYTSCLIPPGDIAVIYYAQDHAKHHDDEDDIDFLVRYLNIDESSLFSIFSTIASPLLPGEVKFTEAIEYREDDYDEKYPIKVKKTNGDYYRELQFKRADGKYWVSYKAMSSSEKTLFLLGLAIATANEISKQKLTLLLIDGLTHILDKDNFRKLTNVLSSGDYQVLSTFPTSMEAEFLERSNGSLALKDIDYLKPWNIIEIQSDI